MTTTLGVWLAPESLDAPSVARVAMLIEELGYHDLWLAETFGRDPFALAAHLGARTERLRLATGIASIFNRHPGAMKQAANTVAEQTGGRFVLGLGVSSPQIVENARHLDYSRPLTRLSCYLDAYDASPYFSVPPPSAVPVVLAALGPKMLTLAAERTSGALTYNMTPEHTATARATLGPERLLAVEQKVMLASSPAAARATAARVLRFYRRAPGYRRAWNALGYTDADIDTPSDRFVDGIVAWGDEQVIGDRVAAHIEAGADHVCIQPLHPEHGHTAVDDAVLRLLAPGPTARHRST